MGTNEMHLTWQYCHKITIIILTQGKTMKNQMHRNFRLLDQPHSEQFIDPRLSRGGDFEHKSMTWEWGQ